MNTNVIIKPAERGIKRAWSKSNGNWDIELSLQNLEVSCLAEDPKNPERLFAGTVGRGVYRSDDTGITWHPCGMEGQIVKSIAISHHDPNIIYAGTKPASMFRTRDAGQTWHELLGFRQIPWRWWWFSPAEKPFQAYVKDIAISPMDEDVILVGIEFGAVVRSEDGGETWSGHLRGSLRDCHALKFHLNDGNWIYEAGGSGGGASFSTDGGQTWEKHGQGLAKNYGVSCAADPADPKIWYISVAPGPSKAYGVEAEAYLYRSTSDNGWHPIGWEQHPLKQMPISLTTVANEPGHLYAGLTSGDIWVSENYGDAWELIPINLGSIQQEIIIR